MWQDVVFALGGIVFYVALIPQVYSTFKGTAQLNPWTILISMFIQLPFMVAYISLSLTGALYVTLLNFFMWVILWWLYIRRGAMDENVHN